MVFGGESEVLAHISAKLRSQLLAGPVLDRPPAR